MANPPLHQTTPEPAANDDAPPPENAISFTDLCAAVGGDEDLVLQRLAGILNKRIEGQTGD